MNVALRKRHVCCVQVHIIFLALLKTLALVLICLTCSGKYLRVCTTKHFRVMSSSEAVHLELRSTWYTLRCHSLCLFRTEHSQHRARFLPSRSTKKRIPSSFLLWEDWLRDARYDLFESIHRPSSRYRATILFIARHIKIDSSIFVKTSLYNAYVLRMFASSMNVNCT